MSLAFSFLLKSAMYKSVAGSILSSSTTELGAAESTSNLIGGRLYFSHCFASASPAFLAVIMENLGTGRLSIFPFSCFLNLRSVLA